jgi:hypothetical protein
LIDLCRGPHVPNTGRIKAFQIMKVSIMLRCSVLGWAENMNAELCLLLPR